MNADKRSKKIEIAIIDDVSLSEEQKSTLSNIGNVRSYSGVAGTTADILSRVGGAEVIILGWTTIDSEILSLLPSVRMISIWATGFDYVDVAFARKQGIAVTNVPGYAGIAVAEHAFGILLSLIRHTAAGMNRVSQGNFSWSGLQGIELHGKTIGIVGVGAIGQEAARIARGFGMKVIGTAANISSEREQEIGIKLRSLEYLQEVSDIVLLACPLTIATRSMINSDGLRRMKSSAYIVNMTRHEVIVQTDLVDALKSGQIAGAALDEIEFPDQELLSLKNVVVTPHLGFYTSEALARKGDICIQNVKSFLNGRPENLVN